MNVGKRYALADYQVTIDVPSELGFTSSSLVIGGEGSYLDSITLTSNAEVYGIVTDASGNWLYNKNYATNGAVTLSLQQVSDVVVQLKTLFNLLYKSTNINEGLTITIIDTSDNSIVAVCEDCVISKIPDQKWDKESSTQDWELLVGKITIN